MTEAQRRRADSLQRQVDILSERLETEDKARDLAEKQLEAVEAERDEAEKNEIEADRERDEALSAAKYEQERSVLNRQDARADRKRRVQAEKQLEKLREALEVIAGNAYLWQQDEGPWDSAEEVVEGMRSWASDALAAQPDTASEAPRCGVCGAELGGDHARFCVHAEGAYGARVLPADCKP